MDYVVCWDVWLGGVAVLKMVRPSERVKQEDMGRVRAVTQGYQRGRVHDGEGGPLAVSAPVNAVCALSLLLI